MHEMTLAQISHNDLILNAFLYGNSNTTGLLMWL